MKVKVTKEQLLHMLEVQIRAMKFMESLCPVR